MGITKNITVIIGLLILTIIDYCFSIQDKIIIPSIVVVLAVFITCFLDGIRDKNIARICDRNPWHLVKWTSMYLLWCGILYLGGVKIFPWWLPIAAISWIVWRLGYRIKLSGYDSDKQDSNGKMSEMFPYLW